MCWYASSCASKSSKDAQLINACEEPDTMVACEGNYVAEGGSLIGVQQIRFIWYFLVLFGALPFGWRIEPLGELETIEVANLIPQAGCGRVDPASLWEVTGPRCIRCASWAPSLKVDNLFGIQCAYHQDCGGSHLTGNHCFIDTFLIGQLLEQCSGIPPPWLVVNSWLTVSAYLIILNVLNNSIVTLFHFLLFLRYALRNLPGMRQLRRYNQRKNEGKMKAGTSETSGEFSLLEWQRTDLVLKEQVPGQACTRNKKCYLYEVYVELRYTSFTETYQFGVTIFVTLPGLKLVILLM